MTLDPPAITSTTTTTTTTLLEDPPIPTTIIDSERRYGPLTEETLIAHHRFPGIYDATPEPMSIDGEDERL